MQNVTHNNYKHAFVVLVITIVFAALTLGAVESNAATTTLDPPVKATVVNCAPDNLNVRSGPGTSYPIIGKLKDGNTVTVTGYTATTGGWLQINAPIAGYVTADKVNVPVTGLTANAATATVVVGKTVTVKMTIIPACATNKTITWTTSSATIATVSSTGVVTGKSVGTATITGKANGKTATTKVTVTPVVVTGVSLSPTAVTINAGKTATLTATVTPSNAANKNVVWASDNAAVASVSNSGVVTAKTVGTATITVTTEDGGKTATAQVTVIPATDPIPVTGVSLDKTQLNISVGASGTLSAKVAPTNATNKSVTWSSDNGTIATVSSKGVVTGKAVGTATITVKTNDGAKTATCQVTVTAASTLKLTDSMKIPKKLEKGTGILVKGKVTSSYKITNVTARIITAKGTEKYKATAKPDAKSYDTNKMDSKLKFSALPLGDYVYEVSATDTSGVSKVLRKKSFTVIVPSTLGISDSMTIPNPLTKGTGVTVKGKVTSNYKIISVTATIKTSGGTEKYSASATPNAKSFDTNKWDSKLKFRKLDVGNYVYKVKAKDESGKSKTLRKTSFSVSKTSNPGGNNTAVNTPLPQSGTGYKRTCVNGIYGTEKTINSLIALGKAWADKGWGLVVITDISLKGGGDYPPHQSHKNGKGVDMRPIRTDGTGERVVITWSTYSRSRTRELIKLILATGDVDHIKFNDSVLVNEFSKVRKYSGHDDHLHIEYK